MANNLTTNPIIIDTTGNIIARSVKVRGILIIASDDTWSVVLNNNRTEADGGTTVFRYDSDIANHRSEYIPLNGAVLDGIWAATLTDITAVLVYLD